MDSISHLEILSTYHCEIILTPIRSDQIHLIKTGIPTTYSVEQVCRIYLPFGARIFRSYENFHQNIYKFSSSIMSNKRQKIYHDSLKIPSRHIYFELENKDWVDTLAEKMNSIKQVMVNIGPGTEIPFKIKVIPLLSHQDQLLSFTKEWRDEFGFEPSSPPLPKLPPTPQYPRGLNFNSDLPSQPLSTNNMSEEKQISISDIERFSSLKPSYRPDTLILRKLPVRWFTDEAASRVFFRNIGCEIAKFEILKDNSSFFQLDSDIIVQFPSIEDFYLVSCKLIGRTLKSFSGMIVPVLLQYDAGHYFDEVQIKKRIEAGNLRIRKEKTKKFLEDIKNREEKEIEEKERIKAQLDKKNRLLELEKIKKKSEMEQQRRLEIQKEQEQAEISRISSLDSRCFDISKFWKVFRKKQLKIDFLQESIKLINQCYNFIDYSKPSIYNGASGVAFLYFQLGLHLGNTEHLLLSKSILENIIHRNEFINISSRHCSFLNGKSGIYSLLASIHYQLGNLTNSYEYLNQLSLLSNDLITNQMIENDDLLYGRAGYLWSISFAMRHTNNFQKFRDISINTSTNTNNMPNLHSHHPLAQYDFINNLKTIISSIFIIGSRSGDRHDAPLLFKWHNKYYLGIGHGLAGVLDSLLYLHTYLDNQQLSLIYNSLKWLRKQTYKDSINIKSSLESSNNKLVQWCHGGSGILLLFLKASQVFPSKKWIIDFAESQGELLSNRGLLKKGRGLCHGVSGNGLALLNLYSITLNDIWRQNALKLAIFSLFCSDSFDREPPGDSKYSLFEGLGGAAIFYLNFAILGLSNANLVEMTENKSDEIFPVEFPGSFLSNNSFKILKEYKLMTIEDDLSKKNEQIYREEVAHRVLLLQNRKEQLLQEINESKKIKAKEEAVENEKKRLSELKMRNLALQSLRERTLEKLHKNQNLDN